MTAPTIEKRRHVRRVNEGVLSADSVPTRPAPSAGAHPRIELHLFTYLVGNLLFWTLWCAISISTHHWYWWPVVPMAAWTAVLVLHLWLARKKVS